MACQVGHLDVVRLLLSVDGIEPGRANANKQTPVNIAAYNGHLEVVRLQLSRPGLDITTADEWGDVPEASARARLSRPSSENTPAHPRGEVGGSRSKVQHSGLTSSFKSNKRIRYRYAENTVLPCFTVMVCQ